MGNRLPGHLLAGGFHPGKGQQPLVLGSVALMLLEEPGEMISMLPV